MVVVHPVANSDHVLEADDVLLTESELGVDAPSLAVGALGLALGALGLGLRLGLGLGPGPGLRLGLGLGLGTGLGARGSVLGASGLARQGEGRAVKDLPYYDVYAPRDATRCLRAVEGARHCGRRGGRRGAGVAAGVGQAWGRRGGRRGAGVAAGVAAGVGQAWGRRGGRGRTTKATSRVMRIHAADMRASSVVMRPTPDVRRGCAWTGPPAIMRCPRACACGHVMRHVLAAHRSR